MDLYYYDQRWLTGPIQLEELRDLVRSEKLTESSPVWLPTRLNWIRAAALLDAAKEASIPSEDTAILAWQTNGDGGDPVEIPSPRTLLALRLAKEQGLITPDQCERCRQEIHEQTEPGLDLPEVLVRRGWITAGQQSVLQAALQSSAFPRLLGGYEILEELGRGSMGTTYKARQISMDRPVALKVLLPQFSQDGEYVKRFEREARMAARLNHENIATAYEVGCVAGQHFFSMEYVEGDTLAQRLAARGPMSEAEAVPVVLQLCRALQAAFEGRLVHRDVSPKNVILRPNGQAKLIDMGLAKSVSADTSSLTTLGVTVGTPAYISPEQALGRHDLDIRSDIYSLGCVLYQMLVGEPPLIGATVLETLTRHIQEPVPPLREKCPQASLVLCAAVARMTALKPEDRFQTPQETMTAFFADEDTARLALSPPEALPPVRDQLAAWTGVEPAQIKLRVDQREYVHLIARHLDARIEAAKIDAETQGYVQTLFAELVTNAFDHGCQGLTEGIVRLRLELNDAFFRLDVEDPGPGFAAAEMLERIRKEPLDRERRRGLMHLLAIGVTLAYSPKGNLVKAVLYRKSGDSGISTNRARDIHYIEIKGKGDLALAEEFQRWVDDYRPARPESVCLMIRTEWVSSMFVAAIGKLHGKLKQSGSALTVWPEHRSCFKILQQLGVSSYIGIYDSLESAELALRSATAENALADKPSEDDREGRADKPVQRTGWMKRLRKRLGM